MKIYKNPTKKEISDLWDKSDHALLVDIYLMLKETLERIKEKEI